MLIRPLDPVSDRTLVDGFFAGSADCIRLERGEDPGPAVTDEFFNDTPPGCDARANLRVGLLAGEQLMALADLAFGYPTPKDAYIGLMMVDPAARGSGAGVLMLRHLEQTARDRGFTGLYLGVLEANPRGRAFWEREGFTLALANRPITLGGITQMAHRLGKAI